LPATRRAAAFAWHHAGVADPRALEGLVLESHDAFNSLLAVNLADLGLCPPEQSLEALVGTGVGAEAAADPYAHPWSGPRGVRPTNLSGGLKSRGHPVGGTGLFQLAEVYLQLVRRFPNPKAQAAHARFGLSHSIGGPGNNVYVTLLERADNKRKPAKNLTPPERRAPPRPPQLAPQALHGRDAVVEAATTIHVTASGEGPIHVALLSVEGRRAFAKIAAPVEDAEELQGRRGRFLVAEDGDHLFELTSRPI
jgi:thiolase-like protein